MDVEMTKHFVGPMPVGEFFEKFLPVHHTPRRSKLAGFELMEGSHSEGEMYKAFVRLFFVVLRGLCI